jgi:hypothetical protein
MICVRTSESVPATFKDGKQHHPKLNFFGESPGHEIKTSQRSVRDVATHRNGREGVERERERGMNWTKNSSMEQSPFEKLTVAQLVKKSTYLLILPECLLLCSQDIANGSCPESTQSNPHLTPLRFISILSSHLRLCLINDLHLSGLQTRILYALLMSTMRATRPAHLNHLDLMTLVTFGEVYKLWNSSLCNFSSIYCQFLPLTSKYRPQHPVLKHPQSMFFP